MNKSPFPGIDPYLERYWRDVHTALMVYSRDAIQDQLPTDLAARVDESVTIDLEEERPRKVAPDVSVSEDEAVLVSEQPVAVLTDVAEPLIVAAEYTERHIEIIDTKSSDRIVTVIEILSPTNKLPGLDRNRYIDKQQTYVKSRSNLVEIDLIRSGDFVVAVSPANLSPEELDSPIVCIRRASRPLDAEIYRLPLREKLPTIRIPLREDDADVALNLQAIVDQAYTRGRYGNRIDYAAEPTPPLSPEDAQWAEGVLRQAGLRRE